MTHVLAKLRSNPQKCDSGENPKFAKMGRKCQAEFEDNYCYIIMSWKNPENSEDTLVCPFVISMQRSVCDKCVKRFVLDSN